MTVPTASQVTGVANTLLRHAGLRRSVHGIEQCGSVLFSQLYEALTGSRPPGGGSEAERCQAVVDAFSEQLSPHVSLGHIRGSDLAARDPLTILHLLDIFSVLFDQHSVKNCHHPPQTDPPITTNRDTSNFISPEGLGIVSEVLQEELGHTHYHTHSYLTNSTGEILRPVPRPHLPLPASHPHSSQPPPSLTITSLTSTTITEQPPPEPAAYEESTITYVPPGAEKGPPGGEEQPLRPVERRGVRNEAQSTSPSPPSTPPPSQRQHQLFSSPLHHSTPRTMAARSRLYPDPPPPITSHTPSTSSHPLSRVKTAVTSILPPSPPHPLPSVTPPHPSPPHPLPSVTLPHPSPPHPLPQATGSTTSESEGEEVAGTHTMTASAAPQTDPPAADQVDETLGRTSLSVQLSRNADTLDSESDQDGNYNITKPDPPPSIPQPQNGPPYNRKLEEVRQEVLASLYQRYLKELQATPAKKSPAIRRGNKSPATRRGNKIGQKKRRTSKPSRTLPRQVQGLRGKGGEGERGGKERDRGREQTTAVGITSDLFPIVEASLPVCPLATETVHHLWRKQLHQITTATKPTSSHPQNINQLSEMERKHTALLEAIKKEIDHTRRMHGQQEARAQRCAVKSQISAKRQATARARRYFNDYELKLKAKLQKKRTNEEQIFRRVFEDGLAILRERERELRRFAKEKRNKQIEKERQQLDAMEQYYRDKFSMLAESLAREREGAAVRDKAQHQLADQLRRELRERLEREVRQLQDCLDRDDDVTHFRELDAQQLRQVLQHILRTH